MIIFYSGDRSKHVSPETLLVRGKSGFMLTFSGLHKGGKKYSEKRFQEYKERVRTRDGK